MIASSEIKNIRISKGFLDSFLYLLKYRQTSGDNLALIYHLMINIAYNSLRPPAGYFIWLEVVGAARGIATIACSIPPPIGALRSSGKQRVPMQVRENLKF